MKLRRQLLLVSLLTLSLPWAGYQYIQEMESALHQGQSAALTASAEAVAARLGSDRDLLQRTGLLRDVAPLAQQIYAHRLPAAAIVDGYSDDWRSFSIEPRHFSPVPVEPPQTFSMNLRAGTYGSRLYLFAEVEDLQISYYHPGRDVVASGDHLLLVRGRDNLTPLVYTLRTSAPGTIAAVARDTRGRVYQEYNIKGFWRERGDGYQVELELPLAFADQGFGFSVVNADTGQPHQLAGSYIPAAFLKAGAGRRLGQLISGQALLRQELSVFSRPGLRLRVVDAHAWQLATAGSLESNNSRSLSDQQPHWLITSLYRSILKSVDLPEYPKYQQGRYNASEVMEALDGRVGSNWYQVEERQLGSAAVPIIGVGDQQLGVVIAEQTSDALLALTNRAFTRLVLLSMGAALVAGLGLLGYASWLSWRIRRLSLAADGAVASDGQIGELDKRWPSSKAGDEIGELSRSYYSLLKRLQGYTDYLKTLADKLSHELRTPLAVVRSSLDNLEHEPLPQQAGIYRERAKSGAERLSRILSAMSEASRVEASIRSAEREVFALDKLLKNVYDAYRDIYPQQALTLEIAPSSQGYDFRGSPDLLVQCLDKLVDNATDFCPPGGGIRLRLNSSGNCWLLRVENDGPLLPENMREQLFDSLVSLREGGNNGKVHETHMGLGLHIVRLVSDFHGGSATAENLADGSGVVFKLALPVTEPEKSK